MHIADASFKWIAVAMALVFGFYNEAGLSFYAMAWPSGGTMDTVWWIIWFLFVGMMIWFAVPLVLHLAKKDDLLLVAGVVLAVFVGMGLLMAWRGHLNLDQRWIIVTIGQVLFAIVLGISQAMRDES